VDPEGIRLIGSGAVIPRLQSGIRGLDATSFGRGMGCGSSETNKKLAAMK
jgi:hypothetical protein